MTLPIPRLPNSELVTLAWCASVLEPYAVASGTTLQGPDPTTKILSWGPTGFVQVIGVGGQPHVHVPLRQPVMSVGCWSANVNGKRPPWGRANAVAELLVAACQGANDGQRPVTLPLDYGLARVVGVVALSEPKRLPSDQANYAHFGFELAIDWLAL